MKKWDVFISYASEDKGEVALPLYNALKDAGIRIWLDEYQLAVGDSLRAKIDEGLVQSRFGVVIISRAFLEKDWPKNELNALVALEEDGHKVILPVWHRINKSILIKYSPILADRLAADTVDGIQNVAAQILSVLFNSSYVNYSVSPPLLLRRLVEVIESDAITSIKTFLRIHPVILHEAFAIREPWITWDVPIPEADNHHVDMQLRSTDSIYFVNFLWPSEKALDSPPVHDAFRSMQIILDKSVFRNPKGIIISGRREQLTKTETERLRIMNRSLIRTKILTYDWLIDAASNLAHGKRQPLQP